MEKSIRCFNHEKSEKEAKQPEHLGLVEDERSVWKNVLGTEIKVKPLPNYVTPEVIGKVEQLGFALRYVPKLDVGTISDLEERGVGGYLAELEARYPKWKCLEGLSDTEKANPLVPRNLQHWYWELVRSELVEFPQLPGQWMAVETVGKPQYRGNYSRTPFVEELEAINGRYVSWNEANHAIKGAEHTILSKVGLPLGKANIRMLEAYEWNLLGNREGWGKTDSNEWTNTRFDNWSGTRNLPLIVGENAGGGAGSVYWDVPEGSLPYVGFRAAVVLDSEE